MAKRTFRIEGGPYGGELTLGEVNPAFARHYAKLGSGEIVDAVLEADGHNYGEQDDALLDPNASPGPVIEGHFNMWENDEFEHLNNSYADGGFIVYEVPADGSDDWDCENVAFSFLHGIQVYGREGGCISDEEPEVINEEEKDGNKYVPVLMFHSCEKGSFGGWFVETDGEDFDEFKLCYGVCETNLGEFIDNVYYDKQKLECYYDNNGRTRKGYEAEVGWLNTKWHGKFSDYNKSDEDYWLDFDENAKDGRENR